MLEASVMSKSPLVCVLLLSLFGLWGCDNGGGSDGDGDADGDSDGDGDVTLDGDVEPDGDPDGDDADVVVEPPYDFEGQAPWYLCPSDPLPEDATVVTAFDGTYQYFGGEDRRTVEAVANFPESTDWVQVGLWLELECPESGLCDHWDRSGSVQLVLNPEAERESWEYLELVRHITPYRIGMCQYIDVTPMASLLVGERTLASFIDTWVGPGHSNGDGWNVTVRFVFYPGPRQGADDVINIWGRRSITVGEIEDDRNVDSQIDPVTVSIPSDASRVEAHLTTTGHSFGNTLNCAEFCAMRQDVIVNGTIFSVDPWRSDCAHNPVSPQYGTWEFDRNGWCPGAIVVGQTIDVTEAVTPGAENLIDFDILLAMGREYDNVSPVDLLPHELVALRLYVYR